jgi:hypothetical protein
MDHTFVFGQEKEEPPSIVGCGSRREFTYRQVYKRVWVGGCNVAMMVAMCRDNMETARRNDRRSCCG